MTQKEPAHVHNLYPAYVESRFFTEYVTKNVFQVNYTETQTPQLKSKMMMREHWIKMILEKKRSPLLHFPQFCHCQEMSRTSEARSPGKSRCLGNLTFQ